ncbi:MAG TPA: hypothetical protein VF050_08720, partial [Moraxellaceae bacterium]
SYLESSYASAGTVMLAGLTTLIGVQLLLGFANFDMSNIPTAPLHKRLHAGPHWNMATPLPEAAHDRHEG